MAKSPPRFVPTLTEVVQRPVSGAAPAGRSADLLVQRVMQRVDLMLERRLRESIATVVLEQTQSLGPRLREEIEGMVREAVMEALQDDDASRP